MSATEVADKSIAEITGIAGKPDPKLAQGPRKKRAASKDKPNLVKESRLTRRQRRQTTPPDPSKITVTEAYDAAPPANCKPCVGYAGTRTFTLQLLAPMQTTLSFDYTPLTDPTAAAEKSVTIALMVE